MGLHSLFENYRFLSLVVPVAITSSANTTGVDLQGYGRDMLVGVQVGAVSGTTPTNSVAIQTSPDNSTWTTQATISIANNPNTIATQKLTRPINHRYVRLAETVAGTSPSFLRSAFVAIEAMRGDDTLNSATPA